MSSNPFKSVDLTIEYVDSVAGSKKTLTAVNQALKSAIRGNCTIFAMPTLALIKQWKGYAEKHPRYSNVKTYEITTQSKPPQISIDKLIFEHIDNPKGGHVLFITHQGLLRVGVWPEKTKEYELIIDEVLDVILSRTPFLLRDNSWVLESFLKHEPVKGSLIRKELPEPFTTIKIGKKKTDEERLKKYNEIIDPNANAAPAEVAKATTERDKLLLKKKLWEERDENGVDLSDDYWQIVPILNYKTEDPLFWLKRREYGKRQDDIYKYLDPIAKWLMQGNPLFASKEMWNLLIMKPPPKPDPDNLDDVVDMLNPESEYNIARKLYNNPDRGFVTITGFMRPDMLKPFKRVTVMSALFQDTMMYAVWQKLGVNFIPSEQVPLNVTTTDLGKRRLNIYWLTDEGWSKRSRNRSGGISKILQLIKDSKVINERQKVCVVVNTDDGSETNPGVVTEVFNNGTVMPNGVRGRNTWEKHHQLIHCSALNSYTSDIRWVENVLGIDSDQQRLGRTGHEVYQALMRLSVRSTTAKSDITLVVMDKDIAEWLVQWFTGDVTVSQIDSSGVIRKKKTGPRGGGVIIGDTKMTNAEKQRRYRLKQKQDSVT